MKSFFRLVFFGLLVGGWGLAALALHVVRTPTAIALIPKNRLGITDTYVDTRGWTLTDASKHPLVVSRVLATGQAELLSHVTGKDGSTLVHQLSDAIRHEKPESATTTSFSMVGVDQETAAVRTWWAMR